MKTPAQVLPDVERRLSRTWHTDACGETVSWPHALPLGEIPTAALAGDFASVQQQVLTWRDWARDHDVPLTEANRRVHGTTQPVPTHATVDSIDTAAALVGGEWPARLARARERDRQLASRFPHVSPRSTVVRTVDGYTNDDFTLLLAAADWFATHDPTGMTPRQVPIPGFHAKWLNTHQPVIRTLTGKDDLGLLPPHPSRIHFTYLDPDYRSTGARLHDSATVGDTFTPAYLPNVVVISENKDTAIHFPPVPGGIAVEGSGAGGSTIASFDWITTAPLVVYWGDMDADGMVILDGFRAAGVSATSILMDLDTFDRYATYGTTVDRTGRTLVAGTRRDLPTLTVAERAVYNRVTDPDWTGVRRIEQERIPLGVARLKVMDLLQPTEATHTVE